MMLMNYVVFGSVYEFNPRTGSVHESMDGRIVIECTRDDEIADSVRESDDMKDIMVDVCSGDMSFLAHLDELHIFDSLSVAKLFRDQFAE